MFNVQPQPYSSNITFNMFNGDTIKNNRIDLGLVPVVVGQQYLQNARYRIAYAPDTSYSILKSVNNGVSYSVLKTGLKPSAFKTTAHDDSRIYDGILFRADKIRFSGSPPNYVGNVGVIKEPTLAPDSIQTRHVGWEWSNPANPFLTGSKFLRDIIETVAIEDTINFLSDGRYIYKSKVCAYCPAIAESNYSMDSTGTRTECLLVSGYFHCK